jgi:predicted secreted hydrolase
MNKILGSVLGFLKELSLQAGKFIFTLFASGDKKELVVEGYDLQLEASRKKMKNGPVEIPMSSY